VTGSDRQLEIDCKLVCVGVCNERSSLPQMMEPQGCPGFNAGPVSARCHSMPGFKRASDTGHKAPYARCHRDLDRREKHTI
jgi:hypothetical protein